MLNKMLTKTRVITLIVSFIVLFLVGEFFIYNDVNISYEAKYEKVDPIQIASIFNYEVNGNSLKVVGEGAYIILDFSTLDKPVYGFKMLTNEPIDALVFPSDNGCFYSGINGEYGYADEIEFTTLKQLNYARIDIASDYSISDFLIMTDISIVKTYKWYKTIYSIILALIVATIISLINPIDILLGEIYRDGNLKLYSLKFLVGSVMAAILSIGFEFFILNRKMGWGINQFRIVIIFTILEIAVLIWVFWKDFIKYLHLFIFMLIILLGASNVIIAPAALGIMWDDETHYTYVTSIVNGMDTTVTLQDRWALAEQGLNTLSQDVYTRQGREDDTYVSSIAGSVSEYQFVSRFFDIGIKQLCYLPAVFGILVGKAFRAPFWVWFRMGKVMNVMCYALLIASSINLLKKRGRLIVAVLGLVPTIVLIASQYTYDWFVIGMIIVAYSKFASVLQSGEKFKTYEWVEIILIFTIGILPKAVYAIIMLPMLLLATNKFEKPIQCRVVLIVAILFLLGSFIVPMLTSVANNVKTGDLRGGTDVNATEQFKYIFANLFVYIGTLFKFLLEYLSPTNAKSYLVNFSYYGVGRGFVINYLALLVAAVIDNRRNSCKCGWIIKAEVIVAALMQAALIATAFYMAYTPVGANTILGCQGRYLLPVLLPVLYFVFENKLEVKEKVLKILSVVLILVPALTFVGNIYMLVVKLY